MRFSVFAALTLALPLAAQVSFTQRADRVLVEIDGKPYTKFFLSPDGNKPYLYPLSTASGAVVTRHFPMEAFPGETNDHPHQRGLFFAHGDINGTNFWATEPGSDISNMGRMRLKKAPDARGGGKSGTIRAVFDGIDAQGRPIMTEDKVGRMVNAEGKETEKNVWGQRSPWVDYDGPVDGRTVGVAIFDNPGNPRRPTYWHARAYGLFAANIFGVRDFTGDKSRDGSMTVERGQVIRFRYRVVVHEGDVRAAQIAGLYRQYAASAH